MIEQKEEVVISGIGGVFPESDNVEELKDLLFDKISAITIDSRRWKISMETPSYLSYVVLNSYIVFVAF